MIENDDKSSSSTLVVIDFDTTGPNIRKHCELADTFIFQDEDSYLTASGHMEQTPLTYSTIKKVSMKNANEIHTRYQNYQKISTEERKPMSCDCLLILDIKK